MVQMKHFFIMVAIFILAGQIKAQGPGILSSQVEYNICPLLQHWLD